MILEGESSIEPKVKDRLFLAQSPERFISFASTRRLPWEDLNRIRNGSELRLKGEG